MQPTLNWFFQEEDYNDPKVDHSCQRIRILKLLKTNDWVATSELRLFSYQYNARIFELRAKGYNIISSKQEGKCGFRLIQ